MFVQVPQFPANAFKKTMVTDPIDLQIIISQNQNN